MVERCGPNPKIACLSHRHQSLNEEIAFRRFKCLEGGKVL